METESVSNKIESSKVHLKLRDFKSSKVYRKFKYLHALELYTEALRMVEDRAQKIALHSNRAACYLKLRDFKKAAQEHTSVFHLDQQLTGSLMLRTLMLRAQTLKHYHVGSVPDPAPTRGEPSQGVPSSSQHRGKGKRKLDDEFIRDSITQLVGTLSSSADHHPRTLPPSPKPLSSLQDAVRLCEELPELYNDVPFWLWAIKFLEDPTKRDAFFGMSAQRRLTFLRAFYEIELKFL